MAPGPCASSVSSLTLVFGGTSYSMAGTTSATGVLTSASFTVPTVPYVSGGYTVAVSDGTNTSANFGTNYVVTPSAGAPSPTSGAPGTTGVTILAQGFIASHALTVTVGGTSATITAGSPTGTNGSTTVTFTIPVVPAGAQSVVVSDGTNSATSATQLTIIS